MKQNQIKRILIVEDEFIQQAFLKLHLEKVKNYQVLIAAGGEEALAIIADRTPDLILLDLRMPGMSGYEVARELKENPNTKQIPIIVLSGVESIEGRIKALEIGVDDFINKPVESAELLLRVKNILQSRDYFLQLQARREHLLQLENLASVGTLINSVTREIRSPLQALQSIISSLSEQYAKDGELLKKLEQASHHAERIDLVTHNTQLYIKSISEQSTDGACNISSVFAQALELLSEKMHQARIEVQTDIPADLPLAKCGAEGFLHVLVHLLLNAYHALKDHPHPQITVNASIIAGDQIMLSICDNNARDSATLYSLIPDPLFSAKLPQVCMSLGLALACHFIEASGGNISVDSKEGRGCCMKVVVNAA